MTKFELDRQIVKKIIIAVVLSVVLAGVIVINVLLSSYQILYERVEGNTHYTDREILSFIETGKFGDNSIYLSLKYKDRSVEDIPFIEKMDVEVVDKNTISVTVYEKALAGYVDYLDQYMYFDREGIIVGSSTIKTAGIPLITGLDFDHFVIDEPLPVENQAVFKTILNVTQQLNKFDIAVDRIYFDKNYEMTLYFDKVRVMLGNEDLIEEKIQTLNGIYKQLKGKSGVLNMKSYEPGNDYKFQND